LYLSKNIPVISEEKNYFRGKNKKEIITSFNSILKIDLMKKEKEKNLERKIICFKTLFFEKEL